MGKTIMGSNMQTYPVPEVDIDPTGAELRPGHPEICQGNGEHPDFEICCDNCDWFLLCFPKNTWKGIE